MKEKIVDVLANDILSAEAEFGKTGKPVLDIERYVAEHLAKQGYRKQSDVITEFKAIVRDYLREKGLYLTTFRNALDYAEKEILNGKAD